MSNLAESYSDLGMHREALQLKKDTLAMRQRTLPEEHPDIALSMGNLASSYSALGMHREALQLKKDTLAMRQRTLPDEHPDIALSMSNLALSYSDLGMHREALQLMFATFKASFTSLSESHSGIWQRYFNLVGSSFSSHPPLACDLMFRLLCLMSAADDPALVRSQLLEFSLKGLFLGVFVSHGRTQDILHFLPLLLDLDSSLANAAAQGNDTALQRCMLLRIVAEACKLGGQLQQALRALDLLDDLATPTIARHVQAQKSSLSGDLDVSAKELQRVRLAVQLQMKRTTGPEPPLPPFHDALVKADAAQVAVPALEAGEFHAASDALVLPPLLYRVGCRVRLHGLLQKQAVLNGAEGMVQSGVENKRVVVRLTRAADEALVQWKEGFKVMTDKVRCLSLFEQL
jgi:tetratricopeptide (TPR) repeat protein